MSWKSIGTEIIPGPVTEFHVDYVTDTKVELSWEAPEGSNATGYQVHYLVADPSLARDIAASSTSVRLFMIRLSFFRGMAVLEA